MGVKQNHDIRMRLRRHVTLHVVVGAIEEQADVYLPRAAKALLIPDIGSPRTITQLTQGRLALPTRV